MRRCPIEFCNGALRNEFGEVSCSNGHDGVRLLDALNGVQTWTPPATPTTERVCEHCSGPLRMRSDGVRAYAPGAPRRTTSGHTTRTGHICGQCHPRTCMWPSSGRACGGGRGADYDHRTA